MFATMKSSRLIADSGVVPPSAAAIAAGVRMTAAHQTLAQRIKQLETERQANFDEIRGLIAGNSGEMNDSAIRKLQKKVEALQVELPPLRMEIRPLRAVHVEAIRGALRPHAVDASTDIVAALAQFVNAVQRFNSCQDEIERYGGDAERIYLPASLGSIEHLARSILEDGK